LKRCFKLFMNLHKDCAVRDIKERLGFRNKSILAGDLNAKHTVWNSQVSNSTGMKLLEVFVRSNSEISGPQCSRITLLMGMVIWTLWYNRTSYCQRPLSRKFWTQITCQSCLAFCTLLERRTLDPIEKLTNCGQFQSIACELSLFPVAPTLQHIASVKRFVSLQILNLKTVGKTPWTGDHPVARPLPTQDK
jgi:hypothetical protein